MSKKCGRQAKYERNEKKKRDEKQRLEQNTERMMKMYRYFTKNTLSLW